MSSLVVGLIAFAFIFGGALLGMFLLGTMPQNHLSDDSKDSVKLGMWTGGDNVCAVLCRQIRSGSISTTTRRTPN